MRFHLKGMLLLALSFVSFSAIADNVTTLELVQNSGETAQFELGKSPVVSTRFACHCRRNPGSKGCPVGG